MTKLPFFPDPIFGWAFLAILAIFTTAAAVIDTRTGRIPKWITLGLLGLGLVVSTIRGGWLGSQNKQLWALETGSALNGCLDGLLFGLAGAAFAFVLFTGMWLLGTCGGGDVKLFTAIGAWFGWKYLIYVWFVSLFVLVVWMIGRFLTGKASLRSMRARPNQKKKGRHADSAGRPKQFRITYSLPIAVATVFVVLWVFRTELGIAPTSATTT